MDSPFLESMACGLAARGIGVVRFEFPYMAARRHGVRRPPDREPVLRAAWCDVVAGLRAARQPARLAVGGKSMGGRIASLMADDLAVDALVCLGYPFHPPKAPTRLRTAHLASLRTPALILQGERDPFGGRDEVPGYALAPDTRVVWVPDGDHSFVPRKASGHTEAHNLEWAVEQVASFLRAIGT